MHFLTDSILVKENSVVTGKLIVIVEKPELDELRHAPMTMFFFRQNVGRKLVKALRK